MQVTVSARTGNRAAVATPEGAEIGHVVQTPWSPSRPERFLFEPGDACPVPDRVKEGVEDCLRGLDNWGTMKSRLRRFFREEVPGLATAAEPDSTMEP